MDSSPGGLYDAAGGIGALLVGEGCWAGGYGVWLDAVEADAAPLLRLCSSSSSFILSTLMRRVCASFRFSCNIDVKVLNRYDSYEDSSRL